MIFRHMLCKGAVLPSTPLQATMGSNAVMVIENLNSGICYLYINFLFDVLIGN